MYAGKAISQVLEMCSSLLGSSLDQEYKNTLERLGRDKHSSLFVRFVSIEENIFITLTAGVFFI